MRSGTIAIATALLCAAAAAGPARAAQEGEWWKPYSPPCTERENVFAFTEKPAVKSLGNDRYEISFAVKGNCDVTVGLVDREGKVVRHLASGVLGPNAPEPLQKNSLRQVLPWNGKDDLDAYVKEPGKLRVRVMLGLKPVFDKRLGGRSPHNLPGYVCGIAVGPEGAVVLSKYWRLHARKFDLDGEYLMSLWPPPANLPESKLAGMGYVEYEPGRKALQSPELYDTVSDRGWMFWGADHGGLGDVQPALFDGRVYFLGYNGNEGPDPPSPMYYLKTDGSTDFDGVRGVPWAFTEQRYPRLACSPDGRWIYMTGVGDGDQFGGKYGVPVVMRRARTGTELAEPFIGSFRKSAKGKVAAAPGSDNESLNSPGGLDCDAQGRIYVCDYANNRIQIFSPEGKYLKTVPADRPMLVRVHQKTGALYVTHTARVEGRSVDRLTKFGPFDAPREVCHRDGVQAGVMALDSWSPKARVWVAGGKPARGPAGGTAILGIQGVFGSDDPVTIYEDRGDALEKLIDFDERARRDDGPAYYGKWRNEKGGSGGSTRLDCDPLRERVYYHTDLMFDLPTGRFLGRWNATPHRAIVEDIAFDKRGYMHIHFNPYFYFQGVGRVDTSRPLPYKSPDFSGPAEYYPEVPYDYGIDGAEKGGHGPYWKGLLPVKDQPGAHGFQCGLGVNMAGDVAVQSYIYYVPKMEDAVISSLNEGASDRRRMLGYESTGGTSRELFMQQLLDMEKRGEAVYFIKRRPGIHLSGGTVWTYERTGSLRGECTATVGRHMDGVEIDEDGKLYFLCDKMRVVGGGHLPFLHGRGGTFGGPPKPGNPYPMTGTLLKTRGKDANILVGGAPVPLDPIPARPPDLIDSPYEGPDYAKGTWAWAEGAEWMYAGVSPVRFRGCNCPSPRFALDWYKRTLAPEAYRHSIAVLDANGNLVLHIGRYGNLDSADGPGSKIPVGDDGIAVFHPRAVSATDNYIVFSSWEEWVTVLKIEYHAEESAPLVP